jgi:hypothetical protein
MDMMYYFGCWDEAGHYLFSPDGHSMSRIMAERYGIPFRTELLDGLFAPRYVKEDDTKTQLIYVHGWTFLAMWDRSVDTRPGSNCVFLIGGNYDEDMMWTIARQRYPKIVARLKAAPTGTS